MQSTPQPTAKRPRWHIFLFLVPFVWQVALAPWANTVAWTPLGLPFQMAWQMVGVVVTSLCLAAIFRSEPGNAAEGDGQ
jgi:Ca2+/H+ antiporter